MDSNGNGKKGEEFACECLKKDGYKIIAKNYRLKCGEIDIVAVKGDIIAFVEVKTRAQSYVVSPAEAVVYSKRRKIINTATLYMQKHQPDLQPRFDVFEVVTKSKSSFEVQTYNHIASAFDVSGK